MLSSTAESRCLSTRTVKVLVGIGEDLKYLRLVDFMSSLCRIPRNERCSTHILLPNITTLKISQSVALFGVVGAICTRISGLLYRFGTIIPYLSRKCFILLAARTDVHTALAVGLHVIEGISGLVIGPSSAASLLISLVGFYRQFSFVTIAYLFSYLLRLYILI